MQTDFSEGFVLLGTIPAGAGWSSDPKRDSEYRSEGPLQTHEKERLVQLNRDYVRGLLAHPRVDANHEQLLTELSEEVEMGRMEGPFQVPPCWYDGSEPTTEEDPDVPCDSVAALAFSIEQTSGDGSVKIRRGEDWKRSFGNRYAFTSDKPDYNDLDDIVTAQRDCTK